MTWTTPHTFVASEVVTASLLNTHIRDNLLATLAGIVTTAGDDFFVSAANTLVREPGALYKTGDQTVISTTTMANITDMSFPVAANESWAFHGFLYVTVAGGTPGFKLDMTIPSAASLYWHGYGVPQALNTALSTTSNVAGRGNVDGATELGGVLTSVSQILEFMGILLNGANAGTAQLRFAQESSSANNVTIKQGSYALLRRLK